MSDVSKWFVIGALALATAGACSGDAATPDQNGPVVQGGGADCGCHRAIGENVDTVHQPLSCLCGAPDAPATCTATVSTFDSSSWCALAPVLRVTGCGRMSYILSGGYSSSEVTFDVATGALVGDAESGDIGFGACSVHSYKWGSTSSACANNVTCTVCGQPIYAPPCP